VNTYIQTFLKIISLSIFLSRFYSLGNNFKVPTLSCLVPLSCLFLFKCVQFKICNGLKITFFGLAEFYFRMELISATERLITKFHAKKIWYGYKIIIITQHSFTKMFGSFKMNAFKNVWPRQRPYFKISLRHVEYFAKYHVIYSLYKMVQRLIKLFGI